MQIFRFNPGQLPRNAVGNPPRRQTCLPASASVRVSDRVPRVRRARPQPAARCEATVPGWPALKRTLLAAGLREAVPACKEAYRVAARAHHGQTRRDGTPYLSHPIRVTQSLVNTFGVRDPALLAAALLHDVVEDSSITLEALKQRFGGRVASLVNWVSKPPSAPGQTGAQRDSAFLLRLARHAPEEAIILKLADRLDNIQDLATSPPRWAAEYRAETMEHVLPLVRRVRPELEPLFLERLAPGSSIDICA